tara:strand:+ start:5370 stop:5834 length:465 start_codon:yes stop_codon:yes gene_type:complete
MNRAVIPIIILVGGVGAYYLIANQDKTPVGLVVRKSLNSGKDMGTTDEGITYRYAIVDGSFRASESSLSLDSLEGQDALLVIFEDDSPIEARIIDPEAWDEEKHNDLAKEYGFDSPDEQETVEEPVLDNAQTQNAESVMFGHIGLNALQSNHCW